MLLFECVEDEEEQMDDDEDELSERFGVPMLMLLGFEVDKMLADVLTDKEAGCKLGFTSVLAYLTIHG